MDLLLLASNTKHCPPEGWISSSWTWGTMDGIHDYLFIGLYAPCVLLQSPLLGFGPYLASSHRTSLVGYQQSDDLSQTSTIWKAYSTSRSFWEGLVDLSTMILGSIGSVVAITRDEYVAADRTERTASFMILCLEVVFLIRLYNLRPYFLLSTNPSLKSSQFSFQYGFIAFSQYESDSIWIVHFLLRSISISKGTDCGTRGPRSFEEDHQMA